MIREIVSSKTRRQPDAASLNLICSRQESRRGKDRGEVDSVIGPKEKVEAEDDETGAEEVDGMEEGGEEGEERVGEPLEAACKVALASSIIDRGDEEGNEVVEEARFGLERRERSAPDTSSKRARLFAWG